MLTPIIILLLIAALCVAAFWHGIVMRRYTIESDKIPAGQTIRAVLISDLHSYIYGENQSRIVHRIILANPDIILLAGDIADDRTPILGTELFLAGIQNIAPIFYVTGNHEYWTRDIAGIKQMFRDFGVTVLEDEYVEVEINGTTLVIAGVCDPECSRMGNRGSRPIIQQALYGFTSGTKDNDNLLIMQQAFGHLEADDGRFKILLSHRPELIHQQRQFPFDLVVSGHSHGGQVRIPFLVNGLFAPNQGLFPPYAGGLYTHDNLTHIVSRGVTINHPRLPRIFNPPEIVVIDIVGE